MVVGLTLRSHVVIISFVISSCFDQSLFPRLKRGIPETKPITTESEGAIQVCNLQNTENSFIFCYGPILRAVNYHSLFADSKTYVDMPLKSSPNETIEEFYRRFGDNITAIDKEELRKFLAEYFNAPGTELETCEPTDWRPFPPKLMSIEDPRLRDWALRLNAIWRLLCKKIKKSEDPSKHSLLEVPNEFIAPGGRFREFYYWDAYWIIKGLLASDMPLTTKKMIDNFISIVKRYGFVPNGGRVYYLQRSQPPLLLGMVYEYFESTGDLSYVDEILPTLEKEFIFWQENRTVDVNMQDGQSYTLFQYRTDSNVPRPESYREDIKSAEELPENKKPAFYRNIASTAESGWDFSTRWFRDPMSIATVQTIDIVPIDLNAFMCWNMDILEYLFRQTGKSEKANKYRSMREEFRLSMQKVFFNSSIGAWFDYNLQTKAHNTEFYPSVAVPLFAGCYQPLNLAKSQRIYEYMKKVGVFKYPGGVPTSLILNSGQQWDFPNGWSPLNHMVIEGLRKSDSAQMQDQAFQIAKKWIHGNYKVYLETGHMWEKYDVIGKSPKPGAGGEYDVQSGFGWTNGVILDLLVSYNTRIQAPNSFANSRISSASTIFFILLSAFRLF